MMRPAQARRVITAAVMLATAAASLVALSGCGVIPGYKSEAVPGSPAAAGPTGKPYVASDHWATQRVPGAAKVAPPPEGAYLGVYAPPAPFDMTRLDRYEKISGRKVSILMWYQPWAHNAHWEFDSATCLAAMRRGAVPLITWEPWNPGPNANYLSEPARQPDYQLQDIIDGKYDVYLREWAWEVNRLGAPVMIRPLHEMNGNWYPWSGTLNGNKPEQYVQAWRHIHDIFDKAGADNVTWVWSINRESVPDTPANAFAAYYPGDKYVDWTSISGFNWGTQRANAGGWIAWEKEYAASLAYLKTLNKPIIISEMGSVEQGGDKAAWLTDAYKRIEQHPEIKGVVYFDSTQRGPVDAQDWRIETSPQSIAAYREAIGSPYYIDTPPQALVDWVNSLSPPNWTYLSWLTPVYEK
jgi:mannan endo-1,4-beta-mannosidase